MVSKFRREDQNRFAEANRLEAGGFDPLGGKLIQLVPDYDYRSSSYQSRDC